MNVTVILDASAVRAYASLQTVSVGELLLTVAEDGDIAGIPVLVLVDVWPDLTKEEQDLIDDLISREDSPAQVLPMLAAAVPVVAPIARSATVGLAQTVAAVQDLGATLATLTPAAYAGHLDPFDLLELS